MDSLIDIVRKYKRSGDTLDALIKALQEWVPEEKLKETWTEYEQLPLQIRKLDQSTTLQDPRLASTLWYDGPQPHDHYWPALKQALLQKGWASGAIERLDR